MTFHEAFNDAAELAKAVTIDEPVSQYFASGFGTLEPRRRFRFRKLRWEPGYTQRIKAIEACRDCCQEWRKTRDGLPDRFTLQNAANDAVGFAPLTVLWIAVMVAQLLAALSVWWDRREPQSV